MIEGKKNKNEIYDDFNLPDKIVIPSLYPDERYEKTNAAKPSLTNIIHAKEWVEFDKL